MYTNIKNNYAHRTTSGESKYRKDKVTYYSLHFSPHEQLLNV